MKKVLIFTLLLFPSLVLAGSVYQVEMLVFDQSSSPSVEQWPGYVDEFDFFQQARKARYTNKIAASRWQLGNAVYALKKSKTHIIYHSAWEQDLPIGHRSNTLRLSGGSLIDSSTSQHEFEALINIKQLRGYFHANVDCLIADSEEAYRITRNTRLKHQETEYLDHPKYGIFLIITPIS